jgi:hypothetical protein
MSAAKDQSGGPAFPRPASATHQHGMHAPQSGMTLRDHFAGLAMQAFTSEAGWRDEVSYQDTAKCAYRQADAMLKARQE